MNKFTAAYCTTRGVRKHNEDMYTIVQPLATKPVDRERGWIYAKPDNPQLYAVKGYLAIVCDGIGGADNGEVASKCAAQDLSQRYYHDPSKDIATSLTRAIEATNSYLNRLRRQSHSKMGTTLTCVVLHENTLYYAGIGDSRIYLIRDGAAHQLTEDDNVGNLTKRPQYLKNTSPTALTKCIGKKQNINAAVFTTDLRVHDRVLLCTDGLSNYVALRHLGTLASQQTPQQSVNSLVDCAYDAHSTDNITAVLIDVAKIVAPRLPRRHFRISSPLQHAEDTLPYN